MCSSMGVGERQEMAGQKGPRTGNNSFVAGQGRDNMQVIIFRTRNTVRCMWFVLLLFLLFLLRLVASTSQPSLSTKIVAISMGALLVAGHIPIQDDY